MKSTSQPYGDFVYERAYTFDSAAAATDDDDDNVDDVLVVADCGGGGGGGGGVWPATVLALE